MERSTGLQTLFRLKGAMNNVLNSNIASIQETDPVQLTISSQPDVLSARQHGRDFAVKLGFTGSDLTLIGAAICEIARNIVDYAQRGEMTFSVVDKEDGTKGMLILARDQGPGIPDVDQALRYGCSTRK